MKNARRRRRSSHYEDRKKVKCYSFKQRKRDSAYLYKILSKIRKKDKRIIIKNIQKFIKNCKRPFLYIDHNKNVFLGRDIFFEKCNVRPLGIEQISKIIKIVERKYKYILENQGVVNVECLRKVVGILKLNLVKYKAKFFNL